MGIGYLRVPADFKNIRRYFLSGYLASKLTGSERIYFLRIGLWVGTISAQPVAISTLTHCFSIINLFLNNYILYYHFYYP